MATTPTTPNPASSAAAAPAAGTSAAPATTTPAATPAATPGAAGTGTPTTATAQQAGSSASQQEHRSTQEIIADKLKEGLKFDAKGDISNAQEIAAGKADEVDKKNELGDGAGDAGATETKAADGETKTAEGEAAAGAETTETEENPYQPNEAIAAKDLSQKLKDNPELAAALEKAPELKNQLYANARLAARVGEYEKIFLSPQEATQAAEAHGTYTMLSGLLNSVDPGNPETGEQFFRAMLEQTYLRDEEGNVLKNEQGNPRTSGKLGSFIKTRFGNGLANKMQALANQRANAEQRGDYDAVDEISRNMEHLEYTAAEFGLRAPAGADEGEIPEEVKREKAALAEREKVLNERDATQRKEAESRFNEEVDVSTGEAFDREIGLLLKGATGLDDHNRATVLANIKRELETFMDSNKFFGNDYDMLLTRDGGKFSPTTRQKVVALNLRYLQDALRSGVAKKALADAGVHLAWQQKRAEDSQAAREAAARGETRTAMGQASPNGAPGTLQIRQSIIDAYKAAHDGDMPDSSYIIAEQLKRGLQLTGTR